MKEQIKKYLDREKETLNRLDVEQIHTYINLLIGARNAGATIFVMGNGGSAATASHMVNDFNKGMSKGDKRFRFICLNDNTPTIMAIANDISYDDIFVEQLKNFDIEGSLVIGLSGSGNSKNVLKAIEWANEHNAITIGITGYTGGKLKLISKYNVHVPIEDMQITEDVHMIFDHLVMAVLNGTV